MNPLKQNGTPMRITATGAGKTAPLEITAVKKNDTAFIGIKGSIYRWNTASSADIDNVIRGFIRDGAIKAEIYINTPGGDVFETNEILNLVDDNFKPENIHVRVGAVCASAGTRFLTKYHSTAKRNSQFMIHKPMGNPSGNEDEIEASLKLIKNITAEYKTAYATKMGITEEEVETMWVKGDYWMTAKEAKAKGLINAIEDEDEKIDAASRMLLVACGAPVIPKIENNQNQNKNMELSVLAVSIGLPATATEAQVNVKLAELKAKAEQADGLLQAASSKEASEKTAKVKALLDAAEIAKKFDAKQRPHFETMANASFEAAEAVIGSMKSITAISDGLTPGASGDGESGREKWTYADYQENAPEAFEKLDEAAQTALISAHYKD